MGIRHLKNLLSQLCKNSGMHYYSNINDFMEYEKNRLYKKMIISEKINNPIKQLQVKKSLENKPYYVGIDAHLYASKYKRIFKKIEYGFLRQIILCLSSKIIPVYIFDGSAPDEKKKIITERKNKKDRLWTKMEDLLFKNIINTPEKYKWNFWKY